jgi:hypothetical protein
MVARKKCLNLKYNISFEKTIDLRNNNLNLLRVRQMINKIIVFEDKKIRRTWHNDDWYYVIEDIVYA